MTPLLEVKDLSKCFMHANGQKVQAVSRVSFSLEVGEVLGVVGESGCGKSTLGHSILHLIEPDSGTVWFDGIDLSKANKRMRKQCRRAMQIIFQDPFGALNPRHKVGHIIDEPLKVHGIGTRASQKARRDELLELVGLPKDATNRYPHAFSGGQRQRIAIARALALNPKLIVADEAVSALDVSIQSQILNLIASLRKKLGLSLIFISHDLSVIRHISDRIAVMYLGRIVEIGPAAQIMATPLHPYTKALLAAVPKIGANMAGKSPVEEAIITGEPPDPANPPVGCAFHSRCPKVMDVCRQSHPPLSLVTAEPHGSETACHLYNS